MNDVELPGKLESRVFRGGVFEISVLTRYIAMSLGNRFPTCRRNKVSSVAP